MPELSSFAGLPVDAAAAGMDPARLGRIDDHLSTRYVEPAKVAGCCTVVARHGRVAHRSLLGLADRERDRPVTDETIWRLYSMTKPVTGVALMTLYEKGCFALSDPVSRFVPSWADLRVAEPTPEGEQHVAPRRPVTVKDLLMHTAGIGYGLGRPDLDVAALSAGRGAPGSAEHTLADLTERLARQPLRFHPGSHWLYSFGTDVCARLVEILSGRAFDDYLRETIFEPLGMADTGFFVPDAKVGRFSACYARSPRKELVLIDDPTRSPFRTPPRFLSGGAGLVSTAHDYLRFCQMLANGGELDGHRVLGSRTIELMTLNHLPGGGQLADMAVRGSYGEVGFEGMGFGLTMAVSLGPVATARLGSPGQYLWGGLASTLFWIDPAEALVVVFLTQLVPTGTFDFRGQLQSLVYSAIVD